MARGGSRPGAGRKPVSPARRREIGGWCEDLHRSIREDERRSRLEARSNTKAIRRHQAEAWKSAARVRRRFVSLPATELRRAIAAPAAEIDKLGRIGYAPARRPKGARARILKEAAKQFGITESVADKYWKEFRRFERRLISSRNPRGQ